LGTKRNLSGTVLARGKEAGMPGSRHADWLRELGFTKLAPGKTKITVACGGYEMRAEFAMDRENKAPRFLMFPAEFDGIEYVFSMVIDEAGDGWVLFSDTAILYPHYLTDLGFTDTTDRTQFPKE
jgi:hypothetical protein